MERIIRSTGRSARRWITAVLAVLLVLPAFAFQPGQNASAESGENNTAEKEWRDIVDVVVGSAYTVALRKDGKVLYAGDDFSGAGKRVAAWDGIQRIELRDLGFYLVGYTKEGAVRLETLLDMEKYSDYFFWPESAIASWRNVVQVNFSASFCLGVTADGRVLAVPRDETKEEMCRAVSEWRDIRQVEITPQGSILGLKADGTVICEASDRGRNDNNIWEGKRAPTNVLKLEKHGSRLFAFSEDGTLFEGRSGERWKNIKSVYSGANTEFGLCRDGTVQVLFQVDLEDPILDELAGWDHIRELGFSRTSYRYVPVGLKEDGTVCAITADGEGQPYGSWDFTGWTDVQRLFSGSDCTIGLRSDGSLLVTGGEFGSLDYLAEIAGWTDIQTIFFAAGEDHTDHIVGLKTDGTLVAAGDNSFGQCNVTG